MVAMSGSAKVEVRGDTQIWITREFDAPRRLVWQAYTEPDLIARWWAGDRGRVTSIEVDLRVGGTWRYVMVANDGTEVAFHGEYREIVPEERLVSTDVFEMFPDDYAGHGDVRGDRRTYDARRPGGAHEPRGSGHAHRLGDGGWSPGGARPPGGGREVAALSHGRGRLSTRARSESPEGLGFVAIQERRPVLQLVAHHRVVRHAGAPENLRRSRTLRCERRVRSSRPDRSESRRGRPPVHRHERRRSVRGTRTRAHRRRRRRRTRT